MASIRKHGSKWVVDFYLGHTRKRLTFLNKNDAESFRRELHLRPLDQLVGYRIQKATSVFDAAEKYLQLASSLKSPATQRLDKVYLDEFKEFFKGSAVDELVFQDIQGYQVHLRKRLAPQTVNRNFSTIKNFFTKCVDWEIIPFNPAVKIKPLKNDRQKVVRGYTPQEVNLMILNAPAYLSDIIFIAFHLGLRRKEIASLRWSALDLEHRLLHVESSDEFHPKGYLPRSLPLRQDLVEFFLRKKRQAEAKQVGSQTHNVFLNSHWTPVKPDTITREMVRLGQKIKMPNLGIHKLRHTFCTNGVLADLSVEKIRILAGHADGRTTEKYLHAASKDLSESMERVGNVIKLGLA